MEPDSRPYQASAPAGEPISLTRSQLHRLRMGWMMLGAGITMGTAGGILRNPWLLSGFLICFATVLLLNRAILKEQL